MTAKEYLYRIKNLDTEVNIKLEELKCLKQKSLGVQPISFEQKVKSSNGNSSNRVIDKIIDLESLINSEINELINIKAEAHDLITQLKNPKHRSLLTEYYLNNKTLEQTAETMRYSYDYIRHLHSGALSNFRKIYNLFYK
nr:MAG: Protein of unknown function (DUF722) [Bacteriophage sp.]